MWNPRLYAWASCKRVVYESYECKVFTLAPEAVKKFWIVIPNMLGAACQNSLSTKKVAIVSGQAKDELDTLKFWFPLRTMIKSLVKNRTQVLSLPTDGHPKWMQSKFLKVKIFCLMQGSALLVHALMERRQNPAGTSSSLHWCPRIWHTTAEFLAWSPEMSDDTSQYHYFSKEFV